MKGGKKSKDCTLILVEGLSTKTFAVQGIQRGVFGKKGRDWFGIYPLRGKLLNVRNSSPSVIAKNNVMSDIMKVLGLQTGVNYMDENFETRYGKVLMLCDADVDGIHYRFNPKYVSFFLFPSLLERKVSYIVCRLRFVEYFVLQTTVVT